MKKKVDINGDALRREREKRALTQEELSERTRLGVRTLRRLEAGQGTLETIKRVTDALAREPQVGVTFEPPAVPDPQKFSQRDLRFDLLELEMSSTLVSMFERDSPIWERVRAIRRHVAFELGFSVPGVRFCDNLQIPPDSYRIKVRELPAAHGQIRLGKLLAIGPEDKLSALQGERTQDPTYGMPAVWIDKSFHTEAKALGVMTFDNVSVVATQLTEVIRRSAHRLLGIDEVQDLLDILDRPALVAELIPGRLSLTTLRSVLRNLLEERVSIRDLGLILETLADHAPGSAEALTEIVRQALGSMICNEYANAERRLVAIVIDPDYERRLEADWERLGPDLRRRLESEILAMNGAGAQAVVVTSPLLRPRLRNPGTMLVCLSHNEIADGYRLEPFACLRDETEAEASVGRATNWQKLECAEGVYSEEAS